MSVSIFSQTVSVKSVDFALFKYGEKISIDVARIEDMPSFAKTLAPYYLTFYDITLITGGSGSFWLDDNEYEIKPNQVLFTTPGQVRRWYVNDLQGLCLFFPADFLLSHLNDPLLLHKFRYFHTSSSPLDMLLNNAQSQLIQSRLNLIRKELSALKPDSDTLMRCIAHETMILLNRWYTQCHGNTQNSAISPTIVKFRQLLASHFFEIHNVNDYAAKLAVTPGHLNVLCKASMGKTASQLINDRIFSEAKRRLVHSSVDIDALSEALGFSSTSYFCRAFKRQCANTPLQYRKLTQSKIKT